MLGAGVSGLVSASILLDQGYRRVTVLDEYDHVGGNHIDISIGDYTFDIGSLVFQDDSPLLRHFPELLPRYLPIDPSWSRVTPQGVVTEYPFSLRDDFVKAGPREAARLVGSAAVGRLNPTRQWTARDYARSAVGNRFLLRSGLDSYIERLCGGPSDEIDVEFARSRMAWVGEQTRPIAVAGRLWRAVRKSGPATPENTQLLRPREGFSALYAPAVDRLTARGTRFLLGRRLTGISRRGERMMVSFDGGSLDAERVIATVPLRRSLELAGLTPPPLPTVTLVSLFFSFDGERGFDDPILYNFTHHARWKRLTVYSDFYGRANGREYFTVEAVPPLGRPVEPRTVNQLTQEFRTHVSHLGLLDGDLRLEGEHVLENAYPVFTRGSGARAEAAQTRLRQAGIESHGRQGGFQYQPTARASTLETEAALESQGEGAPGTSAGGWREGD